MADLTNVISYRNGTPTADVTADAGAASQTLDMDRSDEKFVIRVANADAATATISIVTNGFGGGDASNVTFTVAQNEVKYITGLESMYFKAPATGKATILVTDADLTAFSGTVTNVTFEVVELPKSLVD